MVSGGNIDAAVLAGLLSDVRPRAPRKPRRRTQELQPIEPVAPAIEFSTTLAPTPISPIAVHAPVARHTVTEEEYTW